MVAVIGMGILIVAGVTALVFVMVERMSAAPLPIASAPIASVPSGAVITSALLDEPAGTHIVGSSIGGDRLAVQLGGGGPDRIVIVDTRAGRVIGRVSLSPAAAP